MKATFIISLVSLLIVGTLSNNCSRYKITKDQRCGPKFGHTYCGKGRKCSKWSWCGTSSAYNNGYSKFDGNKVPARCLAKPAPKPKPAKNPCKAFPVNQNWLCGKQHKNTYCKPGYNCSKIGQCGTGVAYTRNGQKKFDGRNLPAKCRPKILDLNVNLLGLNAENHKSGLSGKFVILAGIVGLIIVYMLSRRNSKVNEYARYEMTSGISTH